MYLDNLAAWCESAAACVLLTRPAADKLNLSFQKFEVGWTCVKLKKKKKKNLKIEFKGSFIKQLVNDLLLLFYLFAYKLSYSSINSLTHRKTDKRWKFKKVRNCVF